MLGILFGTSKVMFSHLHRPCSTTKQESCEPLVGETVSSASAASTKGLNEGRGLTCCRGSEIIRLGEEFAFICLPNDAVLKASKYENDSHLEQNATVKRKNVT